MSHELDLKLTSRLQDLPDSEIYRRVENRFGGIDPDQNRLYHEGILYKHYANNPSDFDEDDTDYPKYSVGKPSGSDGGGVGGPAGDREDGGPPAGTREPNYTVNPKVTQFLRNNLPNKGFGLAAIQAGELHDAEVERGKQKYYPELFQLSKVRCTRHFEERKWTHLAEHIHINKLKR